MTVHHDSSVQAHPSAPAKTASSTLTAAAADSGGLSPWPPGDHHAIARGARLVQGLSPISPLRDARREARNDPAAAGEDGDAEPEPIVPDEAAAAPTGPIPDSIAPAPVEDEDRRTLGAVFLSGAAPQGPTGGVPSVGWLAAGGGLVAAVALGGGGSSTAATGIGMSPGGPPVQDPGGQHPVSLGLAKAAGVVQGLPSTNDPVMQVGNLEADGAWFYRVDGQDWIQGQGSTIAASAVVGQGQHKVEVYQMDLAGNRSEVATLDFWVDSEAPTAPTLQIKNNTGDVSDALTSDATLTISGVQPGDQWFFSVDGGEFQAGQGGELSDAQLGGDGTHTVRVVVRDATGNQSAETSLTVERDTTAPTTAPALSLHHDTGADGDRLTSDPWLKLSGMEPGARWSISLDGGKTWTAPASAADPLFRDDAAFDHDGLWRVQARQIDAAGNVGTAITTFDFSLDRQAPATPSVKLRNDSGLSATDLVTNDGTVVIQPGEAGLTLGYRMDGDLVWTNLLDDVLVPDGWSDGAHVIEFVAWDAAGNASEVSSLAFVLDTNAPGLPTLGLGLGAMTPAAPAGV